MTDCNCGMLACPRCFPAHDEVGQHYRPWWAEREAADTPDIARATSQ